MLLPYSSDQPPKNPPLTVVILVLSHFFLFALFAILLKILGADAILGAYTQLSLVPSDIHWYSLMTYGFLHEDVFHLSINMLFLWVFGSSVEEAIGWARFLGIYLLSIVVTGLLQCLMINVIPGADRMTPIVGASGAVSAIIGLYAVRFYRSKVRFIGIPFGIPAILLLAVFLLTEMGLSITSLISRNINLQNVAAHWAHIAGFMLGMLIAHFTHLYMQGKQDYIASDAHIALQRGSPLAAAARWKQLLKLQPENIYARTELAKCWLVAGDIEQASTCFQTAIEQDIKNARKKHAADLYLEMKRAIPNAVIAPEILIRICASLEEQNKYQESLTGLNELLANYSNSKEAEMAIFRKGILLLQKLNEPMQAAEVFADYLILYPESELRNHAEHLLEQARKEIIQQKV
jgi:membrane associated rhomboid family serine protease